MTVSRIARYIVPRFNSVQAFEGILPLIQDVDQEVGWEEVLTTFPVLDIPAPQVVMPIFFSKQDAARAEN